MIDAVLRGRGWKRALFWRAYLWMVLGVLARWLGSTELMTECARRDIAESNRVARTLITPRERDDLDAFRAAWSAASPARRQEVMRRWSRDAAMSMGDVVAALKDRSA